MSNPSLFFVGMTASGKSTIGRCVATELNMPFYDSDKVIEERTGVDISWIFNLEGEEKFRRRETTVIREFAQQKGIVLATGGGAILCRRNREALRNQGVVVHLSTSIDVILERTQSSRQRPLLSGDDPQETLDNMTHERLPLYLQIADVTFESDVVNDRSDLVKKIVDWYRTKFNYEF